MSISTKSSKPSMKSTVYDKRGRILSVGFNSFLKTHPRQKHFADKAGLPEKQYLHAEISSLIKIKSGTPHKILVERYSKDGEPQNAEPCPICKLAIIQAGIKFVEFTVG